MRRVAHRSLAKLIAEQAKRVHECTKLRRESRWMPFVWDATTASLVIGAIVGLSVLFAKMMY
jgi:hypothetical protein